MDTELAISAMYEYLATTPIDATDDRPHVPFNPFSLPSQVNQWSGIYDDDSSDLSELSDLALDPDNALNHDDRASLQLPPVAEGSIFLSKVALKAAITLDSLKQGNASCYVSQAKASWIVLECLHGGRHQQNCPYRAYATSLASDDLWTIKTLSPVHTCSVDVIPPLSMSKQRWFVEYIVSIHSAPPS